MHVHSICTNVKSIGVLNLLVSEIVMSRNSNAHPISNNTKSPTHKQSIQGETRIIVLEERPSISSTNAIIKIGST